MKRSLLSLLTIGAILAGCRTVPPTEPPPPDPVPPPPSVEQTELQRPLQSAPEVPPDNKTPESIGAQVEASLATAGIDATRIRVETPEEGVVVLNGHVSTEADRRRAHELAHAVPGVRNVYIGSLEVENAQALR
jgi:hypothetical protein